MIERLLTRLGDHPHGLLIVIILSFGVGLVLVLPLADEYSALREQAAALRTEIAAAQTEQQHLAEFESRVLQQQQKLAQLEQKTISDERANEFRHDLVALIREMGCSVRRISLSDARGRDWLTEDHALQTIKRGDKKPAPSGFELKTRVLSLSVSGPPERLRALLTSLHKESPLAHTRTLSLRPADTERQEIVMELELWLFDLARKAKVAA